MTPLNAVLAAAGVDPRDVTLLLHRPRERAFAKAAPALALARDPLWDAYQAHHGPGAAAILRKRPLMASFVGRGDGALTFVGLHAVGAETETTPEALAETPAYGALRDRFGVDVLREARAPSATTLVRFDFAPQAVMADRIGRLAAGRPSGRAHVRRADTTTVLALEGAA